MTASARLAHTRAAANRRIAASSVSPDSAAIEASLRPCPARFSLGQPRTILAEAVR